MKRILPWVAAVCFPFLLLVALEVVLRLVNYGGDMRAVAKVDRNGKEFYTMNQRVGKRFFGVDQFYYQKGAQDYFEVDKQPNTVRIFLLGASTTAGFPYEYQATPAWLLHDRLAAAFPDRRIEVINTAITATNSYSVLELVRELIQYDPDLFIVYMGQNEYYGVYGVGSTQSAGKRREMVEAYLWLQHFKTTLLLRNLIFSVMGAPNQVGGADDIGGPTLMEEMASKAIPYGGADYREGERAFRENYSAIIRTAQRHHIPVMLSTLVANEKDLKPFVSFHAEGLPDSSKRRWDELFESGQKAEREKQYSAAIDTYRAAAAIDSIPAQLYFRMGKVYEALGEQDLARAAFIRARDLDGLRFRAPSGFNDIIRGLASDYGMPLADVEAAFREQSPTGSLGRELIWEHVHPTVEGYFLLAKVWFAAMRSYHLFVTPNAWAAVADPPDSLLWEKSTVTPIDEAIARLKIEKLLSRPPYMTGTSAATVTPQGKDEEAVYAYLFEHRISWGDAHYQAAQRHRQAGELREALREYQAVDKIAGSDPIARGLMGDILVDLMEYEEAEPLLRESIAAQDNPYLRFRLGILEMKTDRAREAVGEFQRSLQLIEQQGVQLTSAQLGDVYYYLALAYTQVGRPAEARGLLEPLVSQKPADPRMVKLLSELP